MGTLKEDIKTQSDWIVRAFRADNFKLDYSIESLMEVDRFFVDNMENGKPKKDGRLAAKGFGSILFSIGAYVGETIIKNVPGTEWITDDDDSQGELNASLKLPNGAEIYPIQKVMKRFQNGNEDSIYPYAHMVTQEFTNHTFNEKFWKLEKDDNPKKESENKTESKKTWWKFW